MNGDGLKKKIWEAFRDVLKLQDATGRGALNRKALAQWDSLAHVNLLLTMDAQFGCNLFAQSKAIHSYEDLVRAVSRKGETVTARKDLKRICFIGNCHGYNLFQGAAMALRDQPYQVLYHHVDHILQYLARHDHLSSQARIQAISQNADHLAAGFRRYLHESHILVYSQIFQMEGQANLMLVRALMKRFPARFLFAPMPVPPSLKSYQRGPYAAFYTGHHFLDESVIQARCPGAEPLDASSAMETFYQANGSWSFFTRTSATDFDLDLTHPQPIFWDYFQEETVTPALLQTPPPQIPVPAFKADLTDREAAIKREDPDGFQRLAQTSAPNPFVDEVLKQLWRTHPNLRFSIMRACLRFDQYPKLADLFRQVDWCLEEDLTMNADQARILDTDLVRESRDFCDDEAIHRCVLAFILLYQWSLNHPDTPLQTATFLDAELFQREFVFNKRQRFLGPAPPKAGVNAYAALRRRILDALNGADKWMLYGAGVLSSYILNCLEEGDPKPTAVISGYEREWGTQFHGTPIISAEEAKTGKPQLVVVATRSWYHQEILQLLKQHGMEGFPLFQFPWRESDPIGGHTLAARLKRASFNLTWHMGDGTTVNYTLQDLLCWGRVLVEPIAPKKGDVLPVVLPTSPAVFAVFYYCLVQGVSPTLLSYPTNRRNPEDYGKQIHAVTHNLSAPVLLGDLAMAQMLGDVCKVHVVENLFEPFGDDRPIPDVQVDPDQIAFIQHSSGTTGIQKTVPITHRQALRQLDAYGGALNIQSTDVIASWLPLYHDMGLITSLLGPPLWGVDVAACDPVVWIESPRLILDMIHQHQATLTWWPNFTFAFLARTDLGGWDLSCLRGIVNCSEPVTHEAVSAFTAKAEALGFSARAASACYAMAETTFAVTQCIPGSSPLALPVNQRDLSRGLVTVEEGSNRILMSSGPLLEISEVTILSDDGKPLAHGRIGEICISSSSLFNGYLHGEELDQSSFCEWGYQSGDLGFLWPGENGDELFVTGRKKDLIIMAGENHYPQDLERTAETVTGVKRGRSVAFGAFDPQMQTEILVIAVEEETPLQEADRERVAGEIQRRILETYGLKAAHALVYPIRSMIKSSAGKISRKASKAMILDDMTARRIGTNHGSR